MNKSIRGRGMRLTNYRRIPFGKPAAAVMTFGSGLRRRSIITTSVSAFIPKDRDKLSWLLAGCSRRQCGMQADEAEEEKSKQRPDHRGLLVWRVQVCYRRIRPANWNGR